MAESLSHLQFKQLVRVDKDAARQRLRDALALNGGNKRATAESLGFKPWFLTQQLLVLGLDEEPVKPIRPTRHQILMALLEFRGDHIKAAKVFGVTRQWMNEAIQAYNLRMEAPVTSSPYWNIYR